MFRFEDNAIVFSGWERGIAEAPYEGIADMRNVNIVSGKGEASVAFANASVTLPPVINLESFTGTAASDLITVTSTAGLYEGCAVSIATFTGTGLNTGAATPVDISYAVTGGGGAGGNALSNPTNSVSAGGGGGGGEVKSGTTTLGVGAVTVTIGAGGTAAALGTTSNGNNGSSSVLGSIATSVGGAGGGSAGTDLSFTNNGTNSLGGNGGAGGGAARDPGVGTGGTGTFAGGDGTNSGGAGGGGGSSTFTAGDNGVPSAPFVGTAGGAGGDGDSITINGYSANLGGAGGGGGANNGVDPIAIASGGTGGGGAGGRNNNGSNIVNPVAGTANTGGGGGGGACESSASMQGAAGGSGVVVVSYLTGSMVAYGGTMTTDGLYTVHTFTESGEFTVTSVGSPSLYYVRNLTATTFQLSLYPNSAIVDITGDGTGTFSTYQYGNQRGLTNNGCPVSYWEAPEIGGVLLCDLSNYIWLWQQGDDGASPQNSLLFLGNISGAGARTDNHTGVAYWNGYICVIQQPSTVEILNWETFVSTAGSMWLYDDLNLYLNVLPTATQTSADVLQLVSIRFNPLDTLVNPAIVSSGTQFAAGSAGTTTSPSITLEDGDALVVWSGTYNNETTSTATFDGNAMTLGVSASSTGLRQTVFYYYATGTETGVAVATHAVSVTNRFLYYAVVRGATGAPSSFAEDEDSATTISDSVLIIQPNQIVLSAVTGGETVNFSSGFEIFVQSTAISAGSYSLAYYSGQDATETLKKNVPVAVGDNNILYWGSGEQYIGSLQADPNFNPTGTIVISNQVVTAGLTYNLNAQALDLPETERVESLLMAAGRLYIGATSNKLYPWDTISPSFEDPVEFPEYGLATLIPSNNTFYVLGGNLGRVYATNGASASIYKEVPDEVTGTSRPQFFFWDGNVGNGELYFAFQAYPNGSTTPVETAGGVWAINANSGALRLVQKPTEGYDVLTRMVCPVGHGQSQTFLRPDGQGLLLGYSQDNDHYLEFSTALPYTDYSAYIETDVVAVGTFFAQQTFEHIEYKLATPMVTGESIRVSQRSNLTDSYTQIAEFTTTGLISDQASINWENVQWTQLKIELKSTATNPSFTRLRELRLR